MGTTRLFAKMPEEGASLQGCLASMSNNVVKGAGAFYEEIKEKGNLPWFIKNDIKARAL